MKRMEFHHKNMYPKEVKNYIKIGIKTWQNAFEGIWKYAPGPNMETTTSHLDQILTMCIKFF